MILLRLIFPLLLLLLTSCSAPQDVQNRTLYVFGTLVDISASAASKEAFSAAVTEIQQAFQHMHRDWHAWKPGALLQINQAIAAGQTVPVDADLSWLIRRSTGLSEQSEGLFNPAIGGLIAVWGFHTDEYPIKGPPPGEEQLKPWLSANPQMQDLTIEKGILSSRNPAVQLDFGGMAKGLAVDRAMTILQRHGIDNAIVNAGGDLRARGRRLSGPWRVGVSHPQGQGVIARLEIQGDEAVFTSGNYQRYREYKHERWPHIIDPRNGQPVKHVASVTVVHSDASTADAAATALVVAGLDKWPEIARRMKVSKVMLVDEEGRIFITPEMADRVTFEGEPEVHIVRDNTSLDLD